MGLPHPYTVGLLPRASLFASRKGHCTPESDQMRKARGARGCVPPFGPLIYILLIHVFVGDCWALVAPNAAAQNQNPAREKEKVAVFLRLSPLVGGPQHLPLHAETVLAVGADSPLRSAVVLERDGLEFSRMIEESSQLHRFDFLPLRPTDSVTLVKLTTLQKVPASVRHRRYLGGFGGLEQPLHDARKGLSIIVPLGFLTKSADSVVANAGRYTEQYRNDVIELRVLFGKNCYSFVLDFLFHLNQSMGIKR